MKCVWLFILSVATLDVLQFWWLSDIADQIELNPVALAVYHNFGMFGMVIGKYSTITFAYAMSLLFYRHNMAIYKFFMITIVIMHLFLLFWLCLSSCFWLGNPCR